MELLRTIEAYLKRTGMAASRFGRTAANDPGLVRQLRLGREPGLAMQARIRRFLEGEGRR